MSDFCKVEMSDCPSGGIVAWKADDFGMGADERARCTTREVLTEVLSGRRTVASAAIVLAVGVRQIHRLLIRFREDGGGALIHKSRGQPSNHSVSPGIREYALELVRTRYSDFGPTLAIEVLQDKHAIKVGRETLRT